MQGGFAARSATVSRVEGVARDVFVYRFALDAPLPFAAGQFVNLAVPGAHPRGERSYTVWSSPREPAALDLCVKLFEGGAGSEFLRGLHVGDPASVRGPFGVFTLRPGVGPVVFVATATGLAPFHSMLSDRLPERDPRPFRLYFGVRSQEDLFALDTLDRLRRELPDFDYTVCLSRPGPGWSGFTGRVTQALDAHFPTPDAEFYLCGNGAMIDEVRVLLKERGLDRKRIHVEKYY